jgi:hypothetical protein
MDRAKMYDSRRFIWVKVYNESKTLYTEVKTEVEPESICKVDKD